MTTNNSDWWNQFWIESKAVQGRKWKELMLDLQSDYFHSIYQKYTSGKNFIECGCGEGNISIRMSKFGYHCTMLDYSENALKKSQKIFSNIDKSKKEFIIGDLNNLPIKDNTFDVAFSGGVLEYSNDLDKWIAEMTRILKPGGVFSATIFPKKISIQTLAHFFNTPASFINKIIKMNFKDAFKIRTSFPKSYPIEKYTVDNYLKSCEKANLRIVKCGGSNPFFRLDLPAKIENAYAELLTNKLSTFYYYFNSKDNFFSNTLGITYDIIGIKE